ncbi:PadR family transcriptional regulator [Bariatricus sp. SGI.154]|uniref:PadR family transcriptional regulator n=1 Tax=Bariatricus sp. SGI.154 TaxID=3420549 RepID=UPI003D082BC4
MTIGRNFTSGNNAMLILQLLSEKDMYGYEMIETLSKRSNNVFELKVGTLYPLLHSLVSAGYLEDYSKEVNGKLRKYYKITASGRSYLEKMVKEWIIYADAVSGLVRG